MKLYGNIDTSEKILPILEKYFKEEENVTIGDFGIVFKEDKKWFYIKYKDIKEISEVSNDLLIIFGEESRFVYNL